MNELENFAPEGLSQAQALEIGAPKGYPKLLVRRSESIAQLATSLAFAQAKIEHATKDSTNPFFKSKYADLKNTWNACRGPLTGNGLSIVQVPTRQGNELTVTTILLHKSGEWIEGDLTMTIKDLSPQEQGKLITYCRRYALSSFVGIAPDDDDDGEAAQKGFRKGAQVSGRSQPAQQQGSPPNVPWEHLTKLVAAFSPFNVNRYILEDYCGQKRLEQFTDEDISRCRKLFDEMKNGKITIETLTEQLYGKAGSQGQGEPQPQSEVLSTLTSAFGYAPANTN